MARKQDTNKIGHDSQEKVSGTLDERRKSLWGLNDVHRCVGFLGQKCHVAVGRNI